MVQGVGSRISSWDRNSGQGQHATTSCPSRGSGTQALKQGSESAKGPATRSGTEQRVLVGNSVQRVTTLGLSLTRSLTQSSSDIITHISPMTPN